MAPVSSNVILEPCDGSQSQKSYNKLEECCPWYIFTEKQLEMAQISLQILSKAAAKFVILGRKNQKKSCEIL